MKIFQSVEYLWIRLPFLTFLSTSYIKIWIHLGKMHFWPVKHFFLHFFQCWSLSEVTYHKIHILVLLRILCFLTLIISVQCGPSIMLFFGVNFHGIMLSFHMYLHSQLNVLNNENRAFFQCKYPPKNSIIDCPICIFT